MKSESESPDPDGRARVERQIAEARDVLRGPKRSQRLVRPRKLFVPVALAIAFALVLRKFEQSTGD